MQDWQRSGGLGTRKKKSAISNGAKLAVEAAVQVDEELSEVQEAPGRYLWLTGHFVSRLTIARGPRNSLLRCSEQTGTQWATNCW